MLEKKFNAILSKNDIARGIKYYKKGEGLAVEYLIARLQKIEDFIGNGNQPSINSILTSNFDI